LLAIIFYRFAEREGLMEDFAGSCLGTAGSIIFKQTKGTFCANFFSSAQTLPSVNEAARENP
jgi:hypothetical protein